jgi:hypothetical protein
LACLADKNVVVHQISEFFTPKKIVAQNENSISVGPFASTIQIENLTCAKLFDDYAKSLTGAD